MVTLFCLYDVSLVLELPLHLSRMYCSHNNVMQDVDFLTTAENQSVIFREYICTKADFE